MRFPKSDRPIHDLLCVVAMVVAVALLAPASALAGSRAFLRQITGTPTGPGGAVVPFPSEGRQSVGGVAVDKQGDLWVADQVAPRSLDEFDSSGMFVKTVALKEDKTIPGDLAIEGLTGHVYVTGDNSVGANPPYVEVFDEAGEPLAPAGVFGSQKFGSPAHVAVDNSGDPLDASRCSLSECTVYVTDVNTRSIKKFNTKGEPVDFVGANQCEIDKCGYIKGNEVSGIPGEPFLNGANQDAPTAITVDGEGNIYAMDRTYNPEGSGKPGGAVVEFNPEGVFVRAFTGEENPGLGANRSGWGANTAGLTGVAVDPVTGQVLVSITSREEGRKGAIDVFASSGRYVEQITEAAPGTLLGGAEEMAFDASGNLYLADPAEKAIEVYGIHHVLPALKLAEVSGLKRTEATVSGTVDPEGEKLSACSFEYVTQVAYEAKGFVGANVAQCVPGASEIAAGIEPQPVHADLAGLTSGTTYRYRLTATTAGASGGSAQTEALAFTAPHAPRIDAGSATNVSSAYADLQAQIAPLGAATSYRFEYSSDGSTWVSAPATDAEIGSGGPTGGADVSVVRQIGPLHAGTAYAFRVIATNEVEGQAETTVGGEGAFTTLPATGEGLPDGRTYELLTPPDKGGAEDMFAEGAVEHNHFNNAFNVGYPADNGNEFLFEAHAGFGSFAGPSQNLYVFRRTGAGWAYTPLASPSLGVQALVNPVFDPRDFAQVEFADLSGSAASVGGSLKLNLLGAPGGPYAQISSEAIDLANGLRVNGNVVAYSEVVGASRDLGRVILESPDHGLLPEDAAQDEGSQALYEYTNGALGLASIDEAGEPFQCGAELGGKQADVPVEASGSGGQRHNAVSADGSTIFFTAPDPHAQNDGPGCWNGASENVPQLYVRSAGATVEVSAPEAGVTVPAGEIHPDIYVGASEDGAKVFFLTETALTQDAQGLHDLELYEYDREAPEGARLTRISAGESGLAAGGVVSVPALSADGSAVYFLANGVLASNRGVDGTLASPDSCTRGGGGASDPCNLYRYDTVGDSIVYVAQVNQRDVSKGQNENLSPQPELSWYTTPDGRYLLFASESELSGYSTLEAVGALHNCPEEGNGRDSHCREVYRYSYEPRAAADGSLVCVSCNPSGDAPESNAHFAEGAAGGAPAGGQVRAISDDGSYAFFDSADPLVLGAENHTQDVYEWEALGAGGCELARGCVHLISSGADNSPSFFLGISSYVGSGGETVEAGNVFFGTHARLVPQDTDESGDLYDARVGGGFPAPGGRGPCEGNACENPAPAPIAPTPATLTSASSGNFAALPATPVTKPKPKVKSRKCRKGFVKRGGRCTRRHGRKAKANKTSKRRAGR